MPTWDAVKAALEKYSGPLSFNPAECIYVHTYRNGFQELITYEQCAKMALDRILALEKELLEIYADPDVAYIRKAKQNTQGR